MAQNFMGKMENDILCRKYLANEADKNVVYEKTEPTVDGNTKRYCWFRVVGGTRFWEKNAEIDYRSYFVSILGSISVGVFTRFIIHGTRKDIRFYIGLESENYEDIESIMETYRAYMPGVTLERVDSLPINPYSVNFGGIVTGYPIGVNEAKETYRTVQSFTGIDNICRGMLGCDFVIAVTAERLPSSECNACIERVMMAMEQWSAYVTTTKNEEALKLSLTHTNYMVKTYMDNLEQVNTMLKNSLTAGLWCVNITYSAENNNDCEKLKGIIKSAFSQNSKTAFEAVECLGLEKSERAAYILRKMIIDGDTIEAEGDSRHPINTFGRFKYQTFMDSMNLAEFILMPQVEIPGYYLDDYVEFDMAVRGSNEEPLYIGNICKPGRSYDLDFENGYDMELQDMTRHALVIGITGGGKTNTSKALLSQLYLNHGIPFLVIESAKREYIELMNLREMPSAKNRNFDKLMLFTLGGESSNSVKYRINPFEIVGEGSKKVSIQTHIDYLFATFKASFELYPPMPYVLETSIHEVYKDRGWDIIENNNIYGWDKYPTLTDLYYKVGEVVDRLGYNGEVQSNVKAALQARINSLRIGGKGAMLDTSTSVNIDKLLSNPVVMELEDIGDDDIKSFVIGIILVQLYEYRKSKMGNGKQRLQHVLVVEEAHRLLKNVPGGGDNPRANSVEFFCNMLAEIRTFGQGIMICDQVPTKLAPDTIKNTNLKLVHRTVMKEDREVMGCAMNMQPEQIEYLSSLKRGCAAVYAEGDNKPKLVMLPLMQDRKDSPREVLLDEIRHNLDNNIPGYAQSYNNHLGCKFCRHQCKYIKYLAALDSEKNEEIFKKFVKLLREKGAAKVTYNYILSFLLKYIADKETPKEAYLCLLGETVKKVGLNESNQYRIIKNYAISNRTYI